MMGDGLLFTIRVAAVLMPFAADPGAGDITNFFDRLTADILVFAVAAAAFFFSLAALMLMSAGLTGSERTRTFAVGLLYAALSALALIFLAGTIVLLIRNAASGT